MNVEFTVVPFHGGILKKESKFDKSVNFYKMQTIIKDPNGILAGIKSSLYLNSNNAYVEGQTVSIPLDQYTIKKVEKTIDGKQMVLKVLTYKEKTAA